MLVVEAVVFEPALAVLAEQGVAVPGRMEAPGLETERQEPTDLAGVEVAVVVKERKETAELVVRGL